MKTATLDVGGMSSMLDYRCVEKQLGRIPGVKQVTASIASNSATVEYDENVTNVAALKDKIQECGFHCAGGILPAHLCEPHSDHIHGATPMAQGMSGTSAKPHSAAPAKQAGHEHHAHPMQAPAGKHAPRRYHTIWLIWFMTWVTVPAWTCRRWCAICATSSGWHSSLAFRSFSIRRWECASSR